MSSPIHSIPNLIQSGFMRDTITSTMDRIVKNMVIIFAIVINNFLRVFIGRSYSESLFLQSNKTVSKHKLLTN